jgi:hypothetical protein
MLNDTELNMLATVEFMVAGAISILNGAYVKQADYSASMQIGIGITFICVGLALLNI